MWVSEENRRETLVWILISSTSKDVGNTECFWTKEPVPVKTEHHRPKIHTERHERDKERDGMTKTIRKHYVKNHTTTERFHSCKIWSDLTTINQYSINALKK